MIGTVSPAGGNFEEPVTQATLGTVKTFLGLSADRAYKRFYPAVDPLLSWSRYLSQVKTWYEENLGPGWTGDVQSMLELLKRGDSIYQMIQVAGEEGITLMDFVCYQEAKFLDMVYLQQDAYDEIDVAVPIKRQQENFKKVVELVSADYQFADQDEARNYFTRLTGLFRNLNYAPAGTAEYAGLLAKINRLHDDSCKH